MHTLEELRAHLNDTVERMKEIDGEAVGRTMTSEERTEWDALKVEREQTQTTITELEERSAYIATLAEDKPESREAGAHFHVRKEAARGDDIYDLSTVRMSAASPEDAQGELRDRAKRSVEAARFEHPDADEARSKAHVERLLDTVDYSDPQSGKVGGELARRILITGSPAYKRAFGKSLAGRPLNQDESRALALGAGASGGFSVVYTLDPTIVPTSNFSVNPFRALARIETLSGTNEWKAVTSGAITAAYSPEATQAGDNAPTLAQPDIIVEKAQAFVPYSIELGEDWGALAQEMANLLQDAKDDLEATKFAVGAGHGSTEPKGVITGATATTTAGGVGAYAIADVYKVFEALPARFRPRAQWAMNLFTVDKTRQFDTAGGSGVWDVQPGQRGLGPAADAGGEGTNGSAVGRLLGRNVWESTAMAAALTTGSKIAIVGDWRYFVIVDRIGMNVELLPNLLGANQRPTGQRGLYAYWRNSSDVLSASAFQVLVTG